MSHISQSVEYQPLDGKMNYGGLPRVRYNMREHKLSIIITWTVIFVSSAVSPNVLYFALRYAAKLELGTTLEVASAVFGVFSLFSLVKRFWALLKKNSTCRPVGAPRGAMDFFQWDFIAAFIGITAVVVTGNVLKDIRIFALGTPILVAEVSVQLLIVGLLRISGARAPFRMSSVAKGEPVRSAVLILAEDIIGVDAGEGQTFRQQLNERYLASKTVQNLCLTMDLIWGAVGTVVGIGICVALFVVPNENGAYIIGWVAPWVYAGVMAVFTFVYCQAALKHEKLDRNWSGKQAAYEMRRDEQHSSS